VPQEWRPPRVLQRGVQFIGFQDFMPATSAPSPRRSVSRSRWVATMAAATLVAMALLPRAALTPGPAVAAQTDAIAVSSWPADELLRSIDAPQTPHAVAAAIPSRVQRAARYRPASTIDDALRRRAYEAVGRALADSNG
jgi:hypothetical protein